MTDRLSCDKRAVLWQTGCNVTTGYRKFDFLVFFAGGKWRPWKVDTRLSTCHEKAPDCLVSDKLSCDRHADMWNIGILCQTGSLLTDGLSCDNRVVLWNRPGVCQTVYRETVSQWVLSIDCGLRPQSKISTPPMYRRDQPLNNYLSGHFRPSKGTFSSNR